MIDGSDLGVIAIIGIILLIGIVKKNAIMMIDFALDAERNEGKTPREAIYQACLLRFRPILMTTMAALFGALPLMLGTGTGSELRHPLGITIVGGLIVSQMLTLFTTPVIYLGFDRLGALARADAAPSGAGATEGARRVNLSAPFIRRPVATTLLTIGVALAGVCRLSSNCRCRRCRRSISRRSRSGADAGRQPGDDGDDRRDAARTPSRASSPTSPR